MRWQENGENCKTRSFMICTLRQYNKNNEVEENEVGRVYSTNGGEEECI
jgi:hypothetical protein